MEARETVTSASLWRRRFRPAIALLLACTVILMVAITLSNPDMYLDSPRARLHGRPGQAGQATEGLNGAPNIFSCPREGRAPASDGAGLRRIASGEDIRMMRLRRGRPRAASFPAPPLAVD